MELGRLKALVESGTDALAVLDREGRVLFAGGRLARDVGLDDSKGAPFVDLLEPPDRKPGAALFDEAVAAPRVEQRGELRCRGKIFDVRITSFLDDEAIAAVVWSACDLTEQKRAEGRAAILLESAPDALIVADTAGRVLDANGAAVRLLGYSKAELLARTVDDLVPAQFRHNHAAHRAGYAAAMTPRPMGASGALRALRRDGTEVPVEISLSPAVIGDTKLVIAALRDVSARKEMERLLRESEERHRRIVETAAEGIVQVDAQARITFVNPYFVRLLGFTPGELIGQEAFKLMADEDEAPARDGWEERQRGEGGDHERRIRRKDGSIVNVEVRSAPILDEDGRFGGSLSMVVDVTEKRRLLEEVREQAALVKRSERELLAIIDRTPMGILVRAGEVILYVNPALERALGASPQALVSRSLRELVTPDELSRLMPDPAAPLVAGEARFLRVDGSEVAIHVTPVQQIEFGGEPAFLTALEDITERKEMQSRLMLSDRMASIGMLAASVAHEINNPLTAVTTNIAHALSDLDSLEGGAPEEIATALRDSADAADRVVRIVRDLKGLSRGEKDERESVDVTAVMDASLRMAWNEIRHRARLVKSYEPAPRVLANPARLGQVFLNLVVNAAQAHPAGDATANEICVTIGTAADGRAVIEVKDTGEGIAAHRMPQLFTPFLTTKLGLGTGLGLSISLNIVTALGGVIEVDSKVGIGTTFRVLLPASTAAVQEAPVPTPQASRASRARVLFIDDEVLIGRAIDRILRRQHDVTVAHSASEALEVLRGGARFDLILCDVMMPIVTGIVFYKQLKIEAPQQAAAVVFTTGAFTPEAQEFFNTEAVPCIDKPFAQETLLALIADRICR